MNPDDTAGDLAAIIFNALSTERRVTFENDLPGLFVYVTWLNNGYTIGASFNGVTGEYLAWYNRSSKGDSTEFLAAAIFHKLADRHARQNLPVELYKALYATPTTWTETGAS